VRAGAGCDCAQHDWSAQVAWRWLGRGFPDLGVLTLGVRALPPRAAWCALVIVHPRTLRATHAFAMSSKPAGSSHRRQHKCGAASMHMTHAGGTATMHACGVAGVAMLGCGCCASKQTHVSWQQHGHDHWHRTKCLLQSRACARRASMRRLGAEDRSFPSQP